jgi:hypothetical protein
MKRNSILRPGLFVFLVAIVMAPPARAQQVVDPFRKAIGQISVEYWQPRLDIYRNAIDRILSPGDLALLNGLRVRWSIMVAEQAELRDSLGLMAGSSLSEGRIDMESSVRRSAEILRTMEQAQEIARRYPAGMSEIGRTVLADFGTFAERLPKETDRLLAQSGITITGEAERERRRTLERMATAIGSESGAAGLRSIYDLAFEPIVLLYNGSDLRQMIAETAGATGIDGTFIPEASLLSQNHPNPASGTTTIDYTLREAAASALIRIYDAAGTEVMTLEEGTRPAGTHSRTIDVSSLPSGSYLYQLVIRTDRGDQLYAKVMRVVR